MGEACYLLEYREDGFKDIVKTAAEIVSTIADIVSGGSKVVKEYTKGIIKQDALNDILNTVRTSGSNYSSSHSQKRE